MSADFTRQYGSYAYDSVSGLYVEDYETELSAKLRTADTPGRHGAYSQGGLLGVRHLTLQILLSGTSEDDLRTKLTAFLAAHRPGTPQPFYAHSDRFCWAEVSKPPTIPYDAMARSYVRFEVEFLCVDPLFYKATQSTQGSLASGGTITTGGTERVAPVLTVSLSSVGTEGTLLLTNTTTGQAFLLAPTETGNYIIDSYNQSVTRSSIDKSGECLGEYLQLASGANVLTVDTTGGLTVSALTAAWNDGYLA